MTRRGFALALLLIAVICTADGYRWKWIGPSAGTVDQLIPDRRNPSLWFAANNGTLYRSTDEAKTWRATSVDRLIRSRFSGPGYGTAVSIHPITSEVFAISEGQLATFLWASSDSGKHFGLRNSNVSLGRIIPHPSNPEILYGFGVDPDYGLGVSGDGGKHWTAIRSLPFAIGTRFYGDCSLEYYEPVDFLISPFNSDTIYFSTELVISCPGEQGSEDFTFVSNNAGKSWKVWETGRNYFVTDPLYPERAIAKNSKGIRLLTKQGWKVISNLEVSQLISIPRHPDELMALHYDYSVLNFIQILKSSDFGKSWKSLPINPKNVFSYLAGLDDPNRGLLGATTGDGIYHRDVSHGWQQANKGFSEGEIVQVSSSNSQESVYARTDDPSFLFRTQDHGNTWRNLTFDYPGRASLISVDPKDSKHVVMAVRAPSSSRIIVSRNSGGTWTQSNFDSGGHCGEEAIAYDPVARNQLYLTDCRKLYASKDGGLHFVLLPAEFPNYSESINRMVVDQNDSRIIYFLVPYQGIYKSMDAGKTVIPVNSGIMRSCPDCAITVDDITPLQPKDAYLAIVENDHGEMLYRTNNGGEHWELIAKHVGISRIFAIDGQGQHLYGLDSVHLLESKDGGNTWLSITDDFGKDVAVSDITDPRFHPIYLGTNHGVYVEVN